MRSRFSNLLVLAVVAVLAALPAGAAGPKNVSIGGDVVTGGLTVDQELARQLELNASLKGSEPVASMVRQVRVPVTSEEMAAIEQVDRSESPLRIGLVKAMAPPVMVNGIEQSRIRATDGLTTWAMAIVADQGGAIRLHIENMSLPSGAELYVYNRNGEAFGPYTGRGEDGTGDLWTTAVFGPEAILQLRAPADAAADLRGVTLRITEVGIVSSSFAGPAPDAPAVSFCGNPDCIVDASCYAGGNSIRDAYAKMEWVAGAFLYTCTGAVLNDTNPSSANYFLTANHCLSKANVAKNVTFYWRFRTSTCNGSCPQNNTWSLKTTGSSVAATNRTGDYTLLQLTANPPAGTVRLGFTNAPVANTNGVALHRVSNPNFGPQVYNEQTVSTSAPTCQGWPRGQRIYSYTTLGGTDGGSSGSPVVNASDQVVGQLSGGCGTNVNDPCDNTHNATVDGALASYWSAVQPFLAP